MPYQRMACYEPIHYLTMSLIAHRKRKSRRFARVGRLGAFNTRLADGVHSSNDALRDGENRAKVHRYTRKRHATAKHTNPKTKPTV